MKLRNKVSVILFVLWIFIAGTILLGFHYFFLTSYVALENKDAVENLTRVNAIIDQIGRSVLRTVKDWSIWDDTYQFIVDQNEKYKQSNLDVSSLTQADVDMMLFFNTYGQPIFTKILNKSREGTLPFENFKEYFQPKNVLLEQTTPYSYINGLMATSYGLYFVASHSIVSSRQTGPVHGTLVMGRYISEATIARISEIANIKLNIFPLNLVNKSPDLFTIYQHLSGPQHTYLQKINRENLNAFGLIKDYQNRPIAILKISMPRKIYDIGLRTILYADLILFLSTLLIIFALRISLQKFIIERIEKLNYDMSTASQKNITNKSGSLDEVASVASYYYQATHDPLTGLANRYLLYQIFQHTISKKETDENCKLAIILFDVDFFKRINDTLGHKVGDDLLIHLAKSLTTTLRANDSAARLGGDEFVVLLSSLNEEQITPAVIRLHNKLSEPVILNGHELFVTSSVGIAIYPDDGTDIQSLLKKADIALYQVKDTGGSAYRFYSTALSTFLEESNKKEKELQQAFDNREFCLYYQPIYDCQTQKIISIESLIRWQHPEKGLLSANEIIPIAEKMGLINAIGEWVLYTACQQIKTWQEKGVPVIPVAVNFSSFQTRYTSLSHLVLNALNKTNVDPHLLVIELTETGYIQITPKILEELHELRSYGIQLSVDDFGTGYSGLRYLKSLPVSKLKIDRSFVQDILSNPDDYAITLAIIAIAHQLNLEIIAEGVETKEQYELLKEQGADAVQGYYFSKPVSVSDCEKLLIATAKEIGEVETI